MDQRRACRRLLRGGRLLLGSGCRLLQAAHLEAGSRAGAATGALRAVPGLQQRGAPPRRPFRPPVGAWLADCSSSGLPLGLFADPTEYFGRYPAAHILASSDNVVPTNPQRDEGLEQPHAIHSAMNIGAPASLGAALMGGISLRALG